MPTPNASRALLRTLTGEDSQPARAYYAILDPRGLDAALRRLRCVRPDPAGARWVWLWADEARRITFEVPHAQVPAHLHPIVLGHFRLCDEATLLLDVRSFGRLIEGLRFFGKHPDAGVVRATHVRLVNRRFAVEEGPAAGQSQDAYLEQGDVVRTDPDVLEELPLGEDDVGDFESLRSALRRRNLEALAHWRGTPDVTSFEAIERRLGSASRAVPVATGGHDARRALAPAPARGCTTATSPSTPSSG